MGLVLQGRGDVVSAVLAEELRTITAFADLTAAQLEWIASRGRVEEYAPGASVFEVGSAADSMFAVLDGAVEVMFSLGGQLVPFVTQRRGAVTGLLPFSRMRTYPATGHAVGATRLFLLHRSMFDEMLRVAPALGPTLVSLMTDRARETTRLTQQREKMMALGKLAAGLAHEINNPAAAVSRSADLLRRRLDRLPALTRALASQSRSPDASLPLAMEAATRLAAGARAASPASAASLSARERSVREDELSAWLETRNVPESWLVAEGLVDAGLRPADLLPIVGESPDPATADLIAWLDVVLTAQRLADEIYAAANRVSELVASIKVYSHMDRPGVRERVTLTEGLDSTLVMLGHAVKRKQITLERAYAEDLPQIDAYSGELNQVWTNLIDNALDAMAEGGTLRLETARDGSMAVVRVIDNGSGIPPEILPRIFEAFFTTKPVGDGTGLGLDIVQRIVERQHGGRVEVESRPGRTVFTVRLPFNLPPAAPSRTGEPGRP
jgi:signal transduction histidine kinase